MHTPDGLAADVTRLGVTPGDLLIVHASLRAIGPVEGGAKGVIRALDAAVGPGGTLLMNISARDDMSWVNERPEADRDALLQGTTPFDCLVAPADPEVGVLAEVFRQTPGTVVSNHPEGRFASRGRLAGHLMAEVPWDDYYGPKSPLHVLTENGGKVLRLGADLGTVTLLHYAEYLASVPHKRRVRRHRLVASARGPIVRVIECLDDQHGIVDYPAGDYFAAILSAYLDEGRARAGGVGSTTAELIDAADLVEFATAWMERMF
ncbi:MAG: AAC(3) family N-acetyltransferase [Acidobacteriota bacterium]